jgi:tetratricopeptide (TPR) repeat protein
MKTTLVMKIHLFLSTILVLAISSLAQVPYNSAVPNGYTRKAVVAEQIGLTLVMITYHRPEVRGREGKVWGQLVPKGFVDQGFGNGKLTPWRAGANENTVIEFDNDVKIEGQPLSKGRYALFIAYEPVESTVIFSKRSDAWGSFYYDEKEDALRVKVMPRLIEKSVEHLKYEFSEQTPNSAVIALSWEKLSIPFKVEVDLLKQQFDAFVTESLNPRGWTPQGLAIAANWTLQNNYQLEKGLEWATLATSKTFPGDPSSFTGLSVKAGILDKLGRSDEAGAVLKTAIPLGTMAELQQLGRQLLTAKKPKAALEVFEFNHKKNPDQFPTLVGMARGLSANGEYTKALEFAKKALPLAPNEQNRQAVQTMIDKLKAGKDIN